MVVKTLALDKELSTIHRPSHVVIFVYLLSELWFCFFALLPLHPWSQSYTCTLWKLECLNTLLQIVVSAAWPFDEKSHRNLFCIQEIGDVNAMKAAYLNDEQIVKAPKSGGLDFNLARLASELKVMSHSDKHKKHDMML